MIEVKMTVESHADNTRKERVITIANARNALAQNGNVALRLSAYRVRQLFGIVPDTLTLDEI